MAGRVIHLIPHTHWDREWYLTRAGFLARLVPMLDDLVDRLEGDDRFRSFLLDGQTVLLEDYLRVRPEQRSRVAALVAAGRLQVGPWYVLADELIPSGESLIRNLLVGAAAAAGLGGRLDVLYCPDAFGHPAMLPALAAEFGIEYGVVWRGLGGATGQERDLYRWRAPDGRELTVFHLPPDGYEIGAGLPAGWPAVRERLARRAASRHLGVPVGADHHAAHPALAEAAESLRSAESGAEVRISRLDEFVAAAAADAGEIGSLDGELRWSYGYTWTLQGVHGTRAALKRRHALAELALERAAEPLAALALALGLGDARPVLAEAWRSLLRSQFHDSIAGCTSDPVARRVEARIEDAATLAGEVARQAGDALIGNVPDLARERPDLSAPALLVWNPAARPRAGVAVADLTWLRRDVLVGPPGARVARVGVSPSMADVAAALGGLPVQPLGRAQGTERLDSPHHYPDQDEVEITRVAVQLPPVGGLGFLVTEDGGREPDPLAPVVARGDTLDNGLVRISARARGGITLTDLRTGARYPRLLQVESEADLGDTYTFAPGPPVRRQSPPWKVHLLARGPLVAALELRATLPAGRAPGGGGTGAVDLRLTLTLHAGSAAVRCSVALDNRGCDHRLRLRLTGAARAAGVLAGGPFGPVRRKPVAVPSPGGGPETPVATAPAHRWVAGEGAAGVALLAPGFLEYEHTRGGDLLITLLRAVGQLSRADLPTRPGHAAWPSATPLAQSLGPDRLQLALLPLGGGDAGSAAALAEAWEDVFLPLRPVWLRQATRLAVPAGSLTLEGQGLVLSAVKPAADGGGVVLRCYNATATAVEGRWRLPFAATSASRVRADERAPEPLPLDDGGRSVRFRAAPRAIVTVALATAPGERA
jgi:mannosylglycerate hydrolase